MATCAAISTSTTGSSDNVSLSEPAFAPAGERSVAAIKNDGPSVVEVAAVWLTSA